MMNKKEYMKKYYKNNREKMKKNKKIWIENNREKTRENDRLYYKGNSKRVKEKNERWALKNYIKIRKYKNQWQNNMRKIDLKYNLNDKISHAIRLSLKGNKNGRHWETIVGYTLNDLIKQLKKTIPNDCTWQDFIEGKLQIDHKIPISAFNFNEPGHIDFKRCWALKNLRLLLAKENRIKKDKLNKPFQPALKI